MEFKNQEQATGKGKPELCVSCCQFFGCPDKEKMCSQCFRYPKSLYSIATTKPRRNLLARTSRPR